MDCMGSPTTKQVRPVALGPGGNEAGEQLVLAAAGVLELVDQQVADAVGDGHGGFGGKAVVASKHALSDLRDFDEVDGGGFGEDDLQFGGGMAQQREAGAHDLPVVFGVAGGRQLADGGESGFEAGNGGEAGDQSEELRLFALAVGREAEALVDLLAECAFAGEQQRGKVDAGLARRLQDRRWRERRRGELGQLGELAVELAVACCAGKARQDQASSRAPGTWSSSSLKRGQRFADGIGKGPLKTLAQCVPIRVALENEVVHPAVALARAFRPAGLPSPASCCRAKRAAPRWRR